MRCSSCNSKNVVQHNATIDTQLWVTCYDCGAMTVPIVNKSIATQDWFQMLDHARESLIENQKNWYTNANTTPTLAFQGLTERPSQEKPAKKFIDEKE